MSAYEPDPELMALALDSLRAQTHKPAEIFLVDDASGHAGRAAIDAALARDPDLRLIRMERNCGPYIGRNRVIEAMTGDFLAVQDADDWSHPDRFARQLAAFAALPDRQLVTAPHIRIDAGGRVQPEAGFALTGDGPMTSLFRRSAFEAVGGFARVRSRGDVEMRERLRGYFGGRALHEIDRPMMLCFAAPTTLSQSVRLRAREALQLFRAHIDARPALAGLAADGRRFDPAEIVVPRALRPPPEASR
jgi:glycosyltransferase involved in cell wall biosynthesis